MGYDRTQEFFQAVEELSIGGSNGRRNEAKTTFSDADRAFNALAGEMGGILHNTSVNLQELGKRKLASDRCLGRVVPIYTWLSCTVCPFMKSEACETWYADKLWVCPAHKFDHEPA